MLYKPFETFVLVNNNLCGKLVSLLDVPRKFDDKIKVTLAQFLTPDFNSFCCELDNFT